METIINADREQVAEYTLTAEEAEAERQVDEILKRMEADAATLERVLPKLPPYATGYGPRCALGGLAIDFTDLAGRVIEDAWDKGERAPCVTLPAEA